VPPDEDSLTFTRPALATLGLSHRTVTDADVVVVAMTAGRGDQPARVAVPGAFTSRVVSAVETAAAQVRFTAGPGETARLPSVAGLPTGLVLLVGVATFNVGAGEDGVDSGLAVDAAAIRKAAGAATRAVSGIPGIARALLVLPAGDAVAVRASAEGALLGAYAFTRYRRTPRQALSTITLDTSAARAAGTAKKSLDAAATLAQATAGAIALARDLVNLSPADLYPASFAAVAMAEGDAAGFDVAVLDETALRDGGYGGLVAVGQGSSRGPRLVVCEYRPKRSARHIALVGKGITFDSGGLSLKPPASMPAMKGDMAGAAAVLATVAAAARLGLPVRVTGYLALAENMPSGSAQRPSDVITVLGGTTVEVLNTDAEGRLVLADALVAASRSEPDAIVDVATLTGAATVALGPRTSGLFGTDDALVTQLTDAARSAMEPTWRMPLATELRAGLDSSVADIANVTSKREGGMIVGALFLQEFVGSSGGRPIPWAHLDVAGPAFHEGGAEDVTAKGGTGVPVGTLLRLLEATP